MPTIRQLNQRHPSCDEETVANCRALYAGGRKLRDRIYTFLPKRPVESDEQYGLRCKESHYQNYLGPIVDYFAAMLFTSRPQPVAKRRGTSDPITDPGDYYNSLRDDCDRTGTDIDSFFKARLTEAMVAGKAWVRLHQPNDGVPAINRKDFDDRKLGDAWITGLNVDDVLDWESDDAGNLEWAIVHSKSIRRSGPGSDRSEVIETWEYLTSQDIQIFQVRYPVNSPPGLDDDVPLVGEPIPHRFGTVPLFCIDLPLGLWVAQRIESPQLAHFRLSNAQTWSMSRTCYAMPVFKVTDPDKFLARMGAGYGITVLPTESVEWTAPPSAHFAALAEEVKTHKDEIFRIAHQMALGVENNSAAVGRTAESKIADAQATRVILVAFAKEVKEEIARVYDAISSSRGDDFSWSISGLDEFVTADMLGFLTALALIDEKIGGIPSKTARIQIKTKLVEGLLPELDQETRAKIRTEIEEGIENEPDPTDAEIDQMVRMHTALAGVANGDPAKQPRPGKPGAPKPPKTPGGGKRGVPPFTSKA